MRLTIIFIVLICFDALAQEVLSPRIANYKIDLELDVEHKKVNAQQELTWKNDSNDTITELFFHLYYNAFSNTESTFFKQRGLPSFLQADESSCPWAYSKIVSFKNDQGTELKDRNFVSLDDGNEMDKTVLKITLLNDILPGETRTFKMIWESKIPNIMPRTGYNKEFYFFAQWFPKIGVYEAEGVRNSNGAWNCHQYHSRGEYYADFGNYDVKMTVPENYVIGSSGELINKTINNGKATWHFKVNDVIDFAWGTSPHFVVQKEQWNDVTIKLYTYPNHVNCTKRFFETMKFTLEFLENHLGKYPYKTISIIDPPIHGIFTGGMEYPTLITSLSFCFLPKNFKSTETLTIHEFIHQYFMQMVATHEQEEPWLDEGFTTYYEGRILDELFNKKESFVNVLGIKIGSSEFNRGEFMSSDVTQIAPNSFKSRDFKHGGYGEISYNKTAIWLKTLEGMIGRSTFDKIMKKYFQKWKFKHPSGDDFESVVNEVVTADHGDKFGSNLDWFFDQVLRGTGECDYELYSITNEENTPSQGFLNNYENCDAKLLTSSKYRSSILIRRNGEIQLPVEIRIHFEDGSHKVEQWSGKERSFEFNFDSDQKIISAYIDPDEKNYLDINFINNSLKIKEQKKDRISNYLNFLFRSTQNVLQNLSVFI